MKLLILIFAISFSVNAQDIWHLTTQKLTGAKGSGDEERILFTAQNTTANIQYTVSKNIAKESYLPMADLFNSGNMLVISPSNGELEFYSHNGDVVNSIKFFSGINSDDKITVKFDINANSAAVLASSTNENFTRFILADDQGNIKFQKQVSDKSANGVVNSENYIAVGTSNWEGDTFTEHCTFVNLSGEESGKVDLSFINGKFATDDKHFFGFTSSNIFLTSPEKTNVFWNRELEPDRSIVDADWFENNIVLITSALPVLNDNRWFYFDLVMKEIDIEGNTVREQHLPAGKYEFPRIIIAENKIKILLDSDEYIIE